MIFYPRLTKEIVQLDRYHPQSRFLVSLTEFILELAKPTTLTARLAASTCSSWLACRHVCWHRSRTAVRSLGLFTTSLSRFVGICPTWHTSHSSYTSLLILELVALTCSTCSTDWSCRCSNALQSTRYLRPISIAIAGVCGYAGVVTIAELVSVAVRIVNVTSLEKIAEACIRRTRWRYGGCEWCASR